jgi:predicted enzyme related to lactoylglutathione lyase
MAKYNPVVHFEMPYENRDRAAKFYEQAFGWKMNKLGPEMGNYMTAYTAETDGDRMVKTPGTINGGFYQKTKDPSSHAPSVVIAVEDIEDAMKKVIAAGGKIMSEKPEEIPGVGKWVSFRDSEGTRVSMLQPKKMDYMEKVTGKR